MVSSIESYYATSSLNTRKGFSGLASGMDTDAIIQTMMKASNARLDKLYQRQQKLNWKTSAYQSVTTSLLNFQNKYLSSTASSSVFHSSFFNNTTVTSRGDNAAAVSVKGPVNAVKNLRINSISQMATIAGLTTGVSGSEGAIFTKKFQGTDFTNGKIYSKTEGEAINLKVNGVKYNLSLKDVEVASTAANTDLEADAANIEAALKESIKKAGLSDKMDATLREGKIELTAKEGAGTIEIIGGGKNILSTLGIETGLTTSFGGSAIQGTVNLNEAETYNKVTFQDMKGKSLTFDLDGVKRTITFDDNYSKESNRSAVAFDEIDSADKLATYLNAKMQDAYNGKVTVGSEGGRFKIETTDRSSILSVSSGSSEVLGNKGFLGLNVGSANRLLRYDAITESNIRLSQEARDGLRAGNSQDITINGVTLSVFSNKIDVKKTDGNVDTYHFDEETSVADIMNTINNADIGVKVQYNSTSDNFNLTATESGSLGRIEFSFSEDSTKNQLAEALFGDAQNITDNTKIGKDALLNVSLDGGRTSLDVTRSSNSFTLDGMAITLNKEFTGGEAVTFSGQNNVDDIVTNIKEMVDSYNQILAEVNTQVKQKPDSSYTPLTSSQKKEYSENEVEAYEKKAKEGILFGDSTLSSLATELRFALSLPTNGKSLSSIGITSSTNWEENGKLTVDESVLRQALSEDIEGVAAIFTDGSNGTITASSTDAGAMSRLKSVIEKYASTTGERGILINRAGHESSPLSSMDNAMYRETKALEKEISKMIESIKKEEDKYYNQFASLELFVNQMNAQSSWLTQYTSS